ncbi:peptidoglycan D,D-transpeptidase FtsI family protein [Sporosarcina ureilytica]
MNFLFFSIFILFSLLIFRLGYLQIVKSQDYVRALERTEEIAVNTSVPRGRIFDREGRILVDNLPKNAITYTKMSTTTSKEMLEIAEELAQLIEKDTNRITLGDKRDFWILKNSDEAFNKVTAEERREILSDRSLTKTEQQRAVTRLTRERITDEELNSFSKEDLEVLAIYREMMSGYAFSPQVIKSGDVTPEEFAMVSERLSDFPGVNTTTDWERVRKSTNTILGTTTNPNEGIPKSHLHYYLARDYSRNDRVGRSFFENYYEELLQGQKTVVKNIKDRTGKIIEIKTVREGMPGKDLVLTLDTELQVELEKIVSEKLLQLKSGPNSRYLDRAFLVMLDPNNGEVLSLVGKQVVRNSETGRFEIRDYSFGTFTTRYEIGSTVKMATLLAGYEHGGATVGETKIDEALQFRGPGGTKRSIFNRSFFNRIPMNDIEAIGRSSNIYMFKIALAIGDSSYGGYNSPLRVNLDAFEKMRSSYSALGLGTTTGIDLPGEVGGKPGANEPGGLLNLAIGQYDTYSPLQLAQYVATIANGGYRIAPHVLKEIREPSPDGKTLGPLVQQSEVRVLNRIANTEREIEQVKRGMYYTYYGDRGTARGLFAGKPYDGAGKTGTSETYGYDAETKTGQSTVSLAHVGFAPYDKPEIAYAVLIPHISTGKYTYANNEIVRDAVDKYFELKRLKQERPDDMDVLQEIKPTLKDDEE